MSQKHTPLPWVASYGGYGDNVAVILNADEMPEGKQARLLVEIGHINMTIRAGEANRDLIIRAVNSHDKLVEALEGLLVAQENYDQAYRIGLHTTGKDERREKLFAAKSRARAALQKAQGEA